MSFKKLEEKTQNIELPNWIIDQVKDKTNISDERSAIVQFISANLSESYDKYRMENMYNHNQNRVEHKCVLCVCSAGLLRSPTTAVVLAGEPFNFNTRAAGVMEEYCLILVDKYLLHWADEIVVMTDDIEDWLNSLLEEHEYSAEHRPKVLNLKIADSYRYRDPVLMELIRKRYKELSCVS